VLNRWIDVWTQRQTPPNFKGTSLRIYYGSQVDVAPPTFVFSVNNERYVTRAYEQYLRNRLREDLGFARCRSDVFKARGRREGASACAPELRRLRRAQPRSTSSSTRWLPLRVAPCRRRTRKRPETVRPHLVTGAGLAALVGRAAVDVHATGRDALGEVGPRHAEGARAEHVDPQRRHDGVEPLAGAPTTRSTGTASTPAGAPRA
jgi:hypothetical protein